MATASLEQTLATTNALILRLRETLNSDNPALSPPGKPINPLALASTAASLIKAQTTKLTLLSFNKPFAPSSISEILTSISNSPLVAIVTAAQLCNSEKFGSFAQREIQSKASRLLLAYESLLGEVPKNAVDQDAKLAAMRGTNGSSVDYQAALTGTGLVWEMCDEFSALGKEGLHTAAAKKMTTYQGLFSDALEEITEWLEDGKGENDLDGGLADLDLADHDSDSSSIMSFSSKPTKETILVAEWALAVLHHINRLFPPLIRRRLKRFPLLSGQTTMENLNTFDFARLDKFLSAGNSWSEQIDIVAEGLFENDSQSTIEAIDELVLSAEEISRDAELAWNGTQDELSIWLVQWDKLLQDIKVKNRPPMS